MLWEDYRHFLRIILKLRCMCFKVLCGSGSFLDIVLVAELCQCWLAGHFGRQTLPLRKHTGWIRELFILSFPPSFNCSCTCPFLSLSPLNCSFVNKCFLVISFQVFYLHVLKRNVRSLWSSKYQPIYYHDIDYSVTPSCMSVYSMHNHPNIQIDLCHYLLRNPRNSQ